MQSNQFSGLVDGLNKDLEGLFSLASPVAMISATPRHPAIIPFLFHF
jgi:hypothetical protein